MNILLDTNMEIASVAEPWWAPKDGLVERNTPVQSNKLFQQLAQYQQVQIQLKVRKWFLNRQRCIVDLAPKKLGQMGDKVRTAAGIAMIAQSISIVEKIRGIQLGIRMVLAYRG